MSVSSCSRSLIHSIFSPNELAVELEWLKIRDLFLGQNRIDQDVKRALKLASASRHHDAVYLTKLFEGKDILRNQQAKEVFLAQPDDDARALCFSELVMGSNRHKWSKLRLKRSAELGFAFGQAKFAEALNPRRMFPWNRMSSALRERDGFLWLGYSLFRGFGCEQNRTEGKENFLAAAELGHVTAMTLFGATLARTDPQHWFWCGRAAQKGDSDAFLTWFCDAVFEFKFGSGSDVCMFQIGRALNGHVDVRTQEFFGKKSERFKSLIGPANEAIAYYKSQLAACKLAVDTWTLVGIRFKVVKDIRILIGRLIWETRELCEYTF